MSTLCLPTSIHHQLPSHHQSWRHLLIMNHQLPCQPLLLSHLSPCHLLTSNLNYLLIPSVNHKVPNNPLLFSRTLFVRRSLCHQNFCLRHCSVFHQVLVNLFVILFLTIVTEPSIYHLLLILARMLSPLLFQRQIQISIGSRLWIQNLRTSNPSTPGRSLPFLHANAQLIIGT